MLVLALISTRKEFPILLNDLRLTGEAVEVGTHQGQFANTFLRKWKGNKLHCIDPWKNSPSYEWQAKYLEGSDSRLNDYAKARTIAALHRGRMNLIRALSCEAVTRFPNESLDFVYLDGDHTQPCVSQDIADWWCKVKPGGILAGHDFLCPGANGKPDDWGRIIQPAVTEFFYQERGLDIYLVLEPDGLPWSYYVHKPE